MERRAPRSLTLGMLLTAIAVSLLGWLGSRAGAQRPIDVSGVWTVTLETSAIQGDTPITCTVDFTQSDAILSAVVDCGGLGRSVFPGSIDLRTGAFTLSGTLMLAPVEAEGTVSEDGDQITGSFTALDYITGTFSGARGAEPPPGVDLTGDWLIQLGGEPLRRCRAALEQSGSELSGTFECDGLGSGAVAGPISTNGFSLRGSLSGGSLEIAGIVSQDGKALGGTWRSDTVWWPVAGLREGERAGPADLTGDWNVSLSGGFPLTCRSAIQQTGTDVGAMVDCGVIGPGTLTGTIDPATGVYHLTGSMAGATEVLAVLSEDGAATIGGWKAGSFDLSGALTGRRVSEEPQLIDLSGDWNIALRGQLEGDCTASISQSVEGLQTWAELRATADCGGLGSGTLTGGVEPLGGRLRLDGRLRDLDFSFEGSVSDGERAVRGTWYASVPQQLPKGELELGPYGCFAGVRREDRAPPACDPPAHHPLIQYAGSGGGAVEEVEAKSEFVPSSDSTEGLVFSFAGLGALGASLAAFAFWRLRLAR